MSVPLNGGTKTIAFLVPPDYNSANKYKLILALHGKGDTGPGFRNQLRGFSEKSIYPTHKCILVCPDGGNPADPDQNFHYPAGDEEIIGIALDTALAMYNIDPDYTYLLGWSLGGRSGLKWGLDNYRDFSGLDLWTPAVQSNAEAANQTSKIYFDYNKSVNIPVCITVGTSDSYYGPLKIVRDSLNAAGCNLAFKEFSGSHQAPSQQLMIDCFNHIDTYTGIKPNYNEAGKYVEVYPNPSDGIFHIQTNVSVNEVRGLKVYDLLGKTVFDQKGSGALQKVNYQIDLSQKSGGIYFVETQTVNGSFVEKVLLK